MKSSQLQTNCRLMGIFKIAGLGSTDLLVWPVFVCLTGHCNPSLCILQMVNTVVDNSKTIVGMSFVNGISPPPSFHSHLHHISLTAYHSNEYIHVDNVVVMFNPLYLLISSHLTCPYSCFIWDLVASTLASALLRTVMPITMSDAPNSHCHIPTSYKMSEFLQCPRMEESQCLQKFHWTTFKWYMGRLALMNKHQKDVLWRNCTMCSE